ncbi:MAG: biotin--[acetyl-CoA-carboxylase] ligase [Nitrospira sp.]|nr:MAG: biotin--[acetyl-CoA-carboxylase] ligase [Nitrospira sp.]
MPSPRLTPLTRDSIERALTTRSLGRSLQVLSDTSSTNAVALDAAEAGAPDGAVIVADRQSAGRGRLGRTWRSPGGLNLYCSIIIRHLPTDERLGWLPLISATATAQAITQMTTVSPALKWPNDVMVGTRKVGGILCETHGLGRGSAYAVVGIGLNVNWRHDEMPAELRTIATSLADEGQAPVDRATLLASLLLELESRLDLWRTGSLPSLSQEYQDLCGTIGQPVRVELESGKVLEGIATDVGRDGSLRLIDSTTTPPTAHLIHSGDVRHLRADPPRP